MVGWLAIKLSRVGPDLQAEFFVSISINLGDQMMSDAWWEFSNRQSNSAPEATSLEPIRLFKLLQLTEFDKSIYNTDKHTC